MTQSLLVRVKQNSSNFKNPAHEIFQASASKKWKCQIKSISLTEYLTKTDSQIVFKTIDYEQTQVLTTIIAIKGKLFQHHCLRQYFQPKIRH